MKAIIEVDIPDYQIGQEVSIYFKDTMMIKGIVQEPKIDIRDKRVKDELNRVKDELEPCDCISRQAVDELSKELVHTTRDKADFLCNFWEGLRKLPPVNPQEQKTGHWIWCVGSHKCSNCEEYTCFSHKEMLRYCPNCGARMESEEV